MVRDERLRLDQPAHDRWGGAQIRRTAEFAHVPRPLEQLQYREQLVAQPERANLIRTGNRREKEVGSRGGVRGQKDRLVAMHESGPVRLDLPGEQSR